MKQSMLELLRVSPTPQLLFDGEILEALSPTAKSLFPGAKPGDRADALFGQASDMFQSFQRTGSLLFPVETAMGTRDMTLTAVQNMTLATLSSDGELRSSQTALSVAERLRHSLGTVLAVTPSLLPLLEKTGDAGDLVRASELNRSLYALLRLSRNLENWGAEPLPVELTRTDLDRWLQEQTKELAPLCRMAGRSLIYRGPETRCVAAIHREQLRQALMQLISNAIKFSGPDDEITLSLRRSGQRILITVRDRGCGIAPAQMGQVFSRSENRGPVPDVRWGVGLGLPIVKRIVQAHGGQLMLESREGEGTAVHIGLPAGRSSQTVLKTPVQVPAPENGIDPVMVALADVLPAAAFDTRGLDL